MPPDRSLAPFHQSASPRLVKVTHFRCGDYDCASFVLAPADWKPSEIQQRVDRAMDRYLEAVDAAAAGVEKVGYPHPPQITSKDLAPEMTVAEAQAEFAARKAAYDEAQTKGRYTARNFENFLTDEGFVSLWSDDAEAVAVEVHWGHRHGQRLQYGDGDKLERWPSPKKLYALLTGKAASDYDDEDFA